MGKEAVAIAVKILHNEGIHESKETLYNNFNSWNKHFCFKDPETAAAAIITGSFNAQVKDSLDEIKDFYFCGGLSA